MQINCEQDREGKGRRLEKKPLKGNAKKGGGERHGKMNVIYKPEDFQVLRNFPHEKQAKAVKSRGSE
jgi:hypothetical protein